MENAELNVLIAKYKSKWINQITTKTTMEDAERAIIPVWKDQFGKVPKITILPSPKACRDVELSDAEEYFSLWTISYAATYELAKETGAVFDADKLEMFVNWSKNCHFIRFNEDEVLISQYPMILKLDSRERLHCEDGPALMYEDGLGLYSINGVIVDEQIVLRPETQTIEQIQKETNEEVRIHRLERFGYEKYLEAIDATLLDENRNDIEGTLEFLFEGIKSESEKLVVLLTNCPSTLKKFALEVPNTIKTCADAQYWLSSGLSKRIISAS